MYEKGLETLERLHFIVWRRRGSCRTIPPRLTGVHTRCVRCVREVGQRKPGLTFILHLIIVGDDMCFRSGVGPLHDGTFFHNNQPEAWFLKTLSKKSRIIKSFSARFAASLPKGYRAQAFLGRITIYRRALAPPPPPFDPFDLIPRRNNIIL